MPRQRTPGCGGEHLLDHLRQRLDDVLDVVLARVRAGARAGRARRPRAPTRAVDDPVDADVHGHGHVVAAGLDHERRPPGAAVRRAGCRSVTSPSSSSSAGQVADGAAVQPELARSARRGVVGPVHVHPGRAGALRLLRRSSSCPRPVFVGGAGPPGRAAKSLDPSGGRGPPSADRVDAGGHQQHQPGDHVDVARSAGRSAPCRWRSRRSRGRRDGVDDPALAAEQAGAADDGRADREQQGRRSTGGR